MVLGYEPYETIIKACAVDPGLQSEADLSWVAQKLASEIKTSQNPKLIARQAATSFGAFICASNLGSMKTGKSGGITWKIPPNQILQKAITLPVSTVGADSNGNPSSLKVSLEMDVMQANTNQPPLSAPPVYKKHQAIFSQEEINGDFSAGSNYLTTAANMTNWTEAQIKTYWDGHNRGLELILELLRLKVKAQ